MRHLAHNFEIFLMRVFLLICLFFVSGVSCAADVQVNLSGAELKALLVATGAFQARIDKIPKDSEFTIFLSGLNNYTISIDGDGCCFKIKFMPVKYHGRSIFGGIFIYDIDRVNFEIKRVIGEK